MLKLIRRCCARVIEKTRGHVCVEVEGEAVAFWDRLIISRRMPWTQPQIRGDMHAEQSPARLACYIEVASSRKFLGH
jgi:hypothetical protein